MAVKRSGVNASGLASRIMDDARLWRMIRLLGQNAGALSNALEVGNRPFVDGRWPAASCLHPDVSSGSKTVLMALKWDVCFTHESRHFRRQSACLKGANSDVAACLKVKHDVAN